MSGPFITAGDIGCIGGHAINYTGMPINGFGGSASLFVTPWLDELFFELLIAGKLNVKEVVCAESRLRPSKPPRGAKYRPVCDRVKP